MNEKQTARAQLERVRKAIEAVEGGAQSYSMDGRTLNRADLATLYAREKQLMRRLRGGPRFSAMVAG